MQIDINKIKVSDRIRKDFGGIEELAQDIEQNGLINPIVVTADYQLIAGERRLRAHQYLKREQVTVRIMEISDVEHQLRLEISENEHRKEFTFSERVEWARRLEEVERLKAKERMAGKENLPDQPSGQVRDIVADQAGFGSGKQYDKAKFIMENATPEIIQQLDEGVISTHKAFVETKTRLEAAVREAEERAEQAERDKLELQRQYKDAIPADQLEDAVSAAVERHEEETTVFIRQKEKEAEVQLKQRDEYWKNKLNDDLEKERLKVEQLKSGYQRAKEELEAIKLQQPDDFNDQQAAAQMKKLRFEADSNTIQVSIHVKQFLQKVGITSFMLGAIGSASSSEKKRLSESLDMLEAFVEQIRPAVNGRRAVEK
ncbi:MULTISPECIES: ParB N-terminal domain-containing protein [Paenibacillus]|uniref:ParB N-terminal domain-containing protein n=1 Tax=Paenibacillus polymyxa TaxID=1406 RepID=A0AAJ3IUC4_PAEPO|nr:MULTISPECIES: ParB N-terminal domain-containing protein [Paenibacillus]MDH2332533.1 ParB N-terminal domain-containing protein [Paenibacillus polymyxa]ODA05863.1 plasmid-partitioning protein [Paenibacillus polymyxa]OMF32369.1 plasmid-partitioning protein [Paenibacillus peoriae]OMF72515.1 plasmid-partitioning protein [Paenibacillus peoriae]